MRGIEFLRICKPRVFGTPLVCFRLPGAFKKIINYTPMHIYFSFFRIPASSFHPRFLQMKVECSKLVSLQLACCVLYRLYPYEGTNTQDVWSLV